MRGSLVRFSLTPLSILCRYSFTFDEALKCASAAPPEDRKAKMVGLKNRGDFRQAHPTLEHIIPIYIAAGAAGSDLGERLWTFPEGSLNWAQYRFGDVPTGAVKGR